VKSVKGGVSLSVDLSRLGDRNGRHKSSTHNSRRCELREALTFKPSLRLHVVRALIKKGAIPVSPGRVSQDLKGRVGGFDSRTREIARFS
jgi:hypothetical protein